MEVGKINYLNQVKTLIWKDLLSELKTKEMISGILVFSLLTMVIFNFAFDPNLDTIKQVFPGIMWVAFSFAGITGLNRSFLTEKTNDCLTGLTLCTLDRGVIYLAKSISNFIFMFIVEVITVPMMFILFDYKFRGSPLFLGLIIILGTWGFISIGTFLSALAINTRNSEILLPIILFPLIVPVLIAAVQGTGVIINGGTWFDVSNWLKILLAFGAIFTAVPWILFDYLLEV
ncbi:MAG: heme exporter protein CcmB [Desulfitobacterium sp.]